MKKETKRAGKPARTHQAHWQDNTRTARGDKRKAEMQAAAERDGFATWSEAITAWKNGEYILAKADASKNFEIIREAIIEYL